MASQNPEIYCILVKVDKSDTLKPGKSFSPNEPDKFFKTLEGDSKVIEFVSKLEENLAIEKIIKLDQYGKVVYMDILFDKGKLKLSPKNSAINATSLDLDFLESVLEANCSNMTWSYDTIKDLISALRERMV